MSSRQSLPACSEARKVPRCRFSLFNKIASSRQGVPACSEARKVPRCCFSLFKKSAPIILSPAGSERSSLGSLGLYHDIRLSTLDGAHSFCNSSHKKLVQTDTFRVSDSRNLSMQRPRHPESNPSTELLLFALRIGQRSSLLLVQPSEATQRLNDRVIRVPPCLSVRLNIWELGDGATE